jgi:hypothetical protein
MLPDTITQEAVTDVVNESIGDRDSLADAMAEFFMDIAATLAEKFSLSEEQIEELTDRLAWKVHLLPPDEGS